MKQIRISRTARTSRRPEPPPLAPLPVVPTSRATGTAAVLGRIDRLIGGR